MTLRELFDYLSSNPAGVISFFIVLPVAALLAGWLGRGEGHESPWKYFYSALLFLACIPGIFAATLAVYLFLFERGGSIFNLNLLTQALPIVSMIATLAVVRRNTAFEHVPGFNKLSDLMLMILAVFILMFLIDRTRIVAWVNIPFYWLFAIVAGLLIFMRFGLKRMLS
jgi:hypothetical protein